MASSKDLIRRSDIWRKDLSGRLDRLHRAALEAENAYTEVASRDSARARREARRSERTTQRFPGLAR